VKSKDIEPRIVTRKKQTAITSAVDPTNPRNLLGFTPHPSCQISKDPDSFVGYLKDNMDTFDEETKLGIIDQLMPKDFTKAQN